MKGDHWYGYRLAPKPAKAGQRWTNFEEQELVEMWTEGGEPQKIANLMGRTVPAIMGRLAILRTRGMV